MREINKKFKELYNDFGKKNDNVLDIEKAIQRFYQEFPEHKNDVFILDHQKFENGGQALASIEEALDKATPNIGALLKFNTKSVAKSCFQSKLPVSIAFNTASEKTTEFSKSEARVVIPAGVNFGAKILSKLLAGANLEGMNSLKIKLPLSLESDKMWQEYVLDHEIGHALTTTNVELQEVKDLFYINYLECIADAYASMRNFQKYGEDSELPEYISDLRIRASLLSATTHTTSNAIDAVVELNKQGKIKNLSPQETRDLAIEIAAKAAFTYDEQINVTKEKRKYQTMFVQDKVNQLEPIEDKAFKVAMNSKSPAFKQLVARYFESKLNISLFVNSVNKEFIDSKISDLKKSSKDIEEPKVNSLWKMIREIPLDYKAHEKPKKKPSFRFQPKNKD